MAYEYDPTTGRNTVERNDRLGTKGSGTATPWLLAAAVVVAIVALLWIFGGGGSETQTPPPFGTVPNEEVAPMGAAPAVDGAAPATGGALAPAQPDAAPAPAVPLE